MPSLSQATAIVVPYILTATNKISEALNALTKTRARQYSAITTLALISISSFIYSYTNIMRALTLIIDGERGRAQNQINQEFSSRTAPVRLYIPAVLFTISNIMLSALKGKANSSLNFLAKTQVRRYSFMAVSALVGIGSFAYCRKNISSIFSLIRDGDDAREPNDVDAEIASRRAAIRLLIPFTLLAISNVVFGILLAKKP